MSMRIGTVVRGRETSASFVSAPSSAMALKGREKEKTHLGSAAEVLISRKARLLQLGEKDAKEILRNEKEHDDLTAHGRLVSVNKTRQGIKMEKERILEIKESLKDDTLTDDERSALKEEKEKLLEHIVATSHDDKISMIYDLKKNLEVKIAKAHEEVASDRLRAPLSKVDEDDGDWFTGDIAKWNRLIEKLREQGFDAESRRIEDSLGIRSQEQREFEELDDSRSKLDLWLKSTQRLSEDLEWMLLNFSAGARQEEAAEAVEKMKEEQKKLEEIAKMREGLLPLPPEKAQLEENADDAAKKSKRKDRTANADLTASPAASAAVRESISHYAANH
jgi:hypothetical protein